METDDESSGENRDRDQLEEAAPGVVGVRDAARGHRVEAAEEVRELEDDEEREEHIDGDEDRDRLGYAKARKERQRLGCGRAQRLRHRGGGLSMEPSGADAHREEPCDGPRDEECKGDSDRQLTEIDLPGKHVTGQGREDRVGRREQRDEDEQNRQRDEEAPGDRSGPGRQPRPPTWRVRGSPRRDRETHDPDADPAEDNGPQDGDCERGTPRHRGSSKCRHRRREKHRTSRRIEEHDGRVTSQSDHAGDDEGPDGQPGVGPIESVGAAGEPRDDPAGGENGRGQQDDVDPQDRAEQPRLGNEADEGRADQRSHCGGPVHGIPPVGARSGAGADCWLRLLGAGRRRVGAPRCGGGPGTSVAGPASRSCHGRALLAAGQAWEERQMRFPTAGARGTLVLTLILTVRHCGGSGPLGQGRRSGAGSSPG